MCIYDIQVQSRASAERTRCWQASEKAEDNVFHTCLLEHNHALTGWKSFFVVNVSHI